MTSEQLDELERYHRHSTEPEYCVSVRRKTLLEVISLARIGLAAVDARRGCRGKGISGRSIELVKEELRQIDAYLSRKDGAK